MLSHSARVWGTFHQRPGGSMSKSLRCGALALLMSLVSLGASFAAAQSVSGSVSGTVVDPTRQVVPGVAYTSPSEAPGNSFGSGTPNINGNRATWNTVTVDGAVGNDLGSPNIFSSTINFDAISEVQVQLNNYRAEYGRNGGPVVNIVTKSGSKQYRGSAYWYKRHEGLNANDFFNNRNGIAKPLYRYDTAGATLGGPVPVPAINPGNDKLFFFYSFDGWRSLNP